MNRDSVFTCNNLHCITKLCYGYGWVTFCFHIFCDSCGTNMSVSHTCLACNSSLSPGGSRGSVTLNRIKLEPSKEEKMLRLAGQRPGIIMEMCNAGLAFYQYQKMLELNMLRQKVKRKEERNMKLKDYYEQVIEQFKVKLSKVELELEDAKNEKQAGQEVGLITSASITGTGQGRYRPSSSSEQEHDWFMEHSSSTAWNQGRALSGVLAKIVIQQMKA